jgi:Sel1 repeat/MORN repeat
MKKIILLFSLLFALTTLAQTGCISGNCQNGQGTYAFENGDLYTGTFENGNYTGYGVYFYKNGTVTKGTWQNGKLVKKSIETVVEKNKKVYAGLTIPDEAATKNKTIETKANDLAIAEKYTSKRSGEQNFEKAARIYQKYVDLGDVQSMLELGFLYQFGDSTLPQDYGKALQFFKLAAAQNNNKAQAQIGFYNEYGYGITINNTEAMKWYRIAEANGYGGLKFKSKIFNPNYQPPEPEMVRCTRCDGFGTIYESHYEGGGTYTTGGDPVYGYAQTGTDRFGNTTTTSSVAYKTPTQTYNNPGTEVKTQVTCPVCHGKRYFKKQ